MAQRTPMLTLLPFHRYQSQSRFVPVAGDTAAPTMDTDMDMGLARSKEWAGGAKQLDLNVGGARESILERKIE